MPDGATLNKRNGYDVPDFLPFTEGNEAPPNYKELGLSTGLKIIAGRFTLEAFPGSRQIRRPSPVDAVWMARYFLDHTQNGRLDGSGYVLWHNNKRGHVGRFEICQHKKKAGAGANPVRGWHPGECEKCGLDMSVDSS